MHSSIQSILIVTKARDNRLINLTRELALYLMRKPTHTGRGMVVYVDAQLRTSRRFDAAGMQRDFPELFEEPYEKLVKIDEDWMKSKDGKARWRKFMAEYVTTYLPVPFSPAPLPPFLFSPITPLVG